MKIDKFPLRELRNAELLTFLRNFLMIVIQNMNKKLKVEERAELLKVHLNEMEAVLKKERDNGMSEELEQADKGRDDSLIGIYRVIIGYLRHHKLTVVQASQLLKDFFDNHGRNIHRLNYESQTAVMDKMGHVIEGNEDLRKAFELIHLTEWVEVMTAQNKDFKKLYLLRVKKMALEKVESFKKKRPLAEELYEKVRDRVEAAIEMNDDDKELGRVIVKEANVLINRFRSIIDNRKNQGGDDKGEEEQEGLGAAADIEVKIDNDGLKAE